VNSDVSPQEASHSASRRPAPQPRRRSTVAAASLSLLALAAALAAPALYALWLRPRLLTWGATRDETTRGYPGDELIPNADHSTTMATTLPAPPERVWAWLVQMGLGRGGWYGWDWLDNAGQPSADRIMAQWQHLEEVQRLNSMPGGRNWMTVAVLEPNRTLVLRSVYQLPSFRTVELRSGPLPRAYVDAIWGFHLRPAPATGPGWWPGRALGDARGRSPGRLTSWTNRGTSACRPASSTTCAPGSAPRGEVGLGSGGDPWGGNACLYRLGRGRYERPTSRLTLARDLGNPASQSACPSIARMRPLVQVQPGPPDGSDQRKRWSVVFWLPAGVEASRER